MALTQNQKLLLAAAAAADLVRAAGGWVALTNPDGRLYPGLAINALIRHGFLMQVGDADDDGRPVRVTLTALGKVALKRRRRTA